MFCSSRRLRRRCDSRVFRDETRRALHPAHWTRPADPARRSCKARFTGTEWAPSALDADDDGSRGPARSPVHHPSFPSVLWRCDGKEQRGGPLLSCRHLPRVYIPLQDRRAAWLAFAAAPSTKISFWPDFHFLGYAYAGLWRQVTLAAHPTEGYVLVRVMTAPRVSFRAAGFGKSRRRRQLCDGSPATPRRAVLRPVCARHGRRRCR